MNNSILKPKFQILAAVTLLSAASFTSAADNDHKTEKSMGSAMILGGILAGPPGVVAGMFAGALIGETLEAQSNLDIAETDMQKALNQIAYLEEEIHARETSLAELQTESAHLQENLLTRLEFQMMFRSGDDQLSDADHQRISMLVDYLNNNPQLSVRLDGHADKRGTDEYNNLLALYRAKSVANELTARGIADNRIKIFSQGSSLAQSTDGDYEGYALDRRVNIEVFESGEEKGIAQIN